MSNGSEKELIKRALSYLFLITKMRDQAGFHVTADSKIFVQEVLKPLEKARDEYKSEPAKKALAKIVEQRARLHVDFHHWLDSDDFKKNVLSALRKSSGIQRTDEELIAEAAKYFREDIESEVNPSQQWKKAKKTLIKAGGFAVGTTIVVGLLWLGIEKLKNKKKTGE